MVKRTKSWPARAVALLALLCLAQLPASLAGQGAYFAKKKYVPQPLPVFSRTKGKLPAPIFDEDPAYVDC